MTRVAHFNILMFVSSNATNTPPFHVLAPVVIHTKDWQQPHADPSVRTNIELSHRRATAGALYLCQLIAADACGIDELIIHAPDEESQQTYHTASRLYWDLISSFAGKPPLAVDSPEFGHRLEAVAFQI